MADNGGNEEEGEGQMQRGQSEEKLARRGKRGSRKISSIGDAAKSAMAGDGAGGEEEPIGAQAPRGMDLFAGGLTDIYSSPAYQFLDEQIASGKVDAERGMWLKEKYISLHEVVLKTYEKERSLLSQAKSLNQELLTQRVMLDKTGSLAFEDNTEMGELRRESLKSKNALAVCEEKERATDTELEGHSTQKKELMQEIADIKRRQQDVSAPRVFVCV